MLMKIRTRSKHCFIMCSELCLCRSKMALDTCDFNLCVCCASPTSIVETVLQQATAFFFVYVSALKTFFMPMLPALEEIVKL